MNWRGLRRTFSDFYNHPILHGLSVLTISIALLIVGVFFLCYRNIETIAEKTHPTTTATVYLRDALPRDEIDAIGKKLTTLPSVKKAVFRNKASVVAELESFLGLETRETMPGAELFPDLFEIELRTSLNRAGIEKLKAAVVAIPQVSEVDFSEEWLSQYKKIRQVMKICGAILMTGLLIGCSFIIANFMGMRHQSRRREIEIIRLMGAHSRFIATPFLWEGMIEGLIGAALALLMLHTGRMLASAATSSQWTKMLGIKEWLYLSSGQIALVVMIGLAMAFVGSLTVFFRLRESSEG